MIRTDGLIPIQEVTKSNYNSKADIVELIEQMWEILGMIEVYVKSLPNPKSK